MTKSYIDSKSVNYDRRSALKGAVAIPLAMVPLVASESKAASGPIFSGMAPWTREESSKAFDTLIKAAYENNLSLDLLVDITMHLREDIVLHICKQITEYRSSLPEDEAVQLRQTFLEHKPHVDALCDEVEWTSEPVILTPDDIEFKKKLEQALAKDLELETAIMDSTPITLEGIACVVRTFAECDWTDPNNNRLLAFAERLEEKRALS